MVAERTFERFFAGVEVALERDLGRRGDEQLGAHALDDLGAPTAQQTREGVLRQCVRNRGHRGEDRRGVGAEADGDREPLAGMLGTERLVIGGAAAVREPAHDDLVAADDLLAIDAQVLPVVERPARRREPPGDQRRDVVGPAGLNRPVGEIDGRAFDDDLLARRSANGFRRHVQDFFEERQRAPRFADAARRLRRAQRGEQPAELRQRLTAVVADRGRDSLLGAEQVAEHADTARARAREQQSGTALREHAARDLRELERRADGRVDRFELAAALEMGEKFAQILERALRFEPDGVHDALPRGFLA